jgi:hypothetical protein
MARMPVATTNDEAVATGLRPVWVYAWQLRQRLMCTCRTNPGPAVTHIGHGPQARGYNYNKRFGRGRIRCLDPRALEQRAKHFISFEELARQIASPL